MKIYIVTGQTATGKTSYALNLARQCDGELINCDSRQIYKHLDIITGKDLTDKTFHSVQIKSNFDIGYYKLTTNDQQPTTKIWLYDVVDPKVYFSSFDYQQCAIAVITDIMSRGKTPIIVGGTYFYLKHLLYDIGTENIQPNWELRHNLENKTVEQLQAILTNKSKTVFDLLNHSDRNNPQRLIRKIEIISKSRDVINHVVANKITLLDKLNMSHSSSSRVRRGSINPTNLQIKFIGLKYNEKNTLHTKIENRVEERIQAGSIQEVEQLLKLGYSENDPGLQTIGYQQIIKYFKKEYSKEEAIKEWITKEKQYAKRQDTFMKKDKNIFWKIISS